MGYEADARVTRMRARFEFEKAKFREIQSLQRSGGMRIIGVSLHADIDVDINEFRKVISIIEY
jgi:hypothetical protein